MNVVEVRHISRAFGNKQAVSDVTFDVEQGEMFGMLGPNGAGKTTTIRLILDLYQPDRGQITIFGGTMDEPKKSRIGYMPEERGLYIDLPLDRCLLYLARLKGAPEDATRQNLYHWLERFDLSAHRDKKIKELSKGMQQKAQFINTLLHNPELIIVDEPFSGLDPLNVQLVKEILQELRSRGVTIILSSHQMHLVEALCDRIVLIHQGRNVLYGNLQDIRQHYSAHAVSVRTSGDLSGLPGVQSIQREHEDTRLNLSPNTTPQDIFNALAQRQIEVEKFEVATPSLDEIFIQAVGENQ